MPDELTTGKDFRDDIQRESVRVAMMQLPTMQTGSFIVALALSFSVREVVSHLNLAVWLVMVLAIVVSRIVLYYRFLKVRAERFDGDYWVRNYLVLTFMSGAFWGLSAFLVFPSGSPGLISLFLLAIASLAAATTVSHSSIRMAPASWAGPVLLLYTIRCVMEGGQFGYTVAALIILYLFAIIRFSFTHNNTIISGIALRFQNLELLAEVQTVNETLRRDIARRKDAEEALRKSEERHRQISDLIADFAYSCLKPAGGVFVIDWLVGAVDVITGYSREEIEHHGWWKFLVHPEDLPIFEKNVIELGPGDVSECELRIVHRDGSIRWLRALSRVIENSSNPPSHRLLGCCEEITKRKRAEDQQLRAEAQLRQSQRLEAIGTLAGGIAHDFNNVLTIIMGYIGLVAMESPENETTGEHSKEAMAACLRAKDLIRQILSFSRADDQTERFPLDLRPIVKEVIKFFKASLPATIEIHQNISTLECTILAHATQIHQVLTNLCANAAQAMEERGGILEIRLANVDLGPLMLAPHPDLKPGPYVRLTVADTGHGMDSATLERIFDPYFTTKEAGKGTGLGLAVVHGIVKSHDGVIMASSEISRGTVFDVYWPRIDSKAGPLGGPRPALPTGTERILFIDDEAQVTDIWQKTLDTLGYMVTTRTSCLEALELFRLHPEYFNLVITDYTMPHMNGIDLARQMKAIRPDIPIILCTGLGEGSIKARLKDTAVRVLLMKPLELREVAETIRKVLDEKLQDQATSRETPP